ncbi:hypothetical protein ACZ91_41425 [Streptomyces regensis]|nr:hypothetical protein ACZ91_41425 [Streptomyces regensis]
MHIAILGTGQVATTLTQALTRTGHTVVAGSTGKDPAADAAFGAPVTDLASAARQGEVVINAVMGSAALEVLSGLEKEIADKVLLDVSNALVLDIAEGQDPHLTFPDLRLLYPNSSLAAQLQKALPEAKVVKSLNTLNIGVSTSPEILPGPTTVFLSGNDADAKATVSRLLTEMGWPVDSQIDLGDVRTARDQEHYFLLYYAMVRALGTVHLNLAIVR